MPRWSRLQDEYLWEHCNEGAERIAKSMRARFGVARTAEAVRRHAYRIGAPLVVYEICPECGAKVDHVCRSGMCYRCTQLSNAEAQRRRNDELRAQLRANAERDVRRAEREYDAARAEASRLRRKLRAL